MSSGFNKECEGCLAPLVSCVVWDGGGLQALLDLRCIDAQNVGEKKICAVPTRGGTGSK